MTDTKQIDQLLRDADMCVKLAACGDVESFAKASALIGKAREALAPVPPESTIGECADEALKIAERIKPHLAGRRFDIQGAALAELLSLWIAGHYQGGQELMDKLLELHVKMVRDLIPVNVKTLALRQGPVRQ